MWLFFGLCSRRLPPNRFLGYLSKLSPSGNSNCRSIRIESSKILLLQVFMHHLKSYRDNLVAVALERERNGGRNELTSQERIGAPHAVAVLRS